MEEQNATIHTCQQALSSVEIETRAKGAPAFKVKVYAADVAEAARLATEQYDALVQRYATTAE
jgi:hypothetical protein